MTQVVPLFRASWRMMLRSRGIAFILIATPVQLLAWSLLKNLRFGLGPTSIDFFDFVVPGMSAFLAAHLLQDVVVALAAGYRSRGVLRRLATTPVSVPLLIASQMASYLLLGLWNAAFLLAVGKLAGAHIAITANLLWILPLEAIVVLTALALAFAIAGIARTPQGANSISFALGIPLAFLTGATYPVQALPGALPQIVEYAVPYTSVIKAIRGIALDGAGITAYRADILVGLGWLALAFALAVRFYRLTEGDARPHGMGTARPGPAAAVPRAAVQPLPSGSAYARSGAPAAGRHSAALAARTGKPDTAES